MLSRHFHYRQSKHINQHGSIPFAGRCTLENARERCASVLQSEKGSKEIATMPFCRRGFYRTAAEGALEGGARRHLISYWLTPVPHCRAERFEFCIFK